MTGHLVRITRGHLQFVAACLIANVQAALEYRVSFVTTIAGMIINDALLLYFWLIFFGKFSSIQGWHLHDVLLLYAIVPAAFGVANLIFGNSSQISLLIASGGLDYYLALPRPVLLHVLVTRTHISAAGDLLFGGVLFVLIWPLTPATVGLYLVVVLCGALLFTAFDVSVNALAFFTGNAGGLTNLATNALITLATYPTTLYGRLVQAILWTLLPVAFLNTVPVSLLTHFSWSMLAILVGGVLSFGMLALLIFSIGLRRYESGNAIVVIS